MVVDLIIYDVLPWLKIIEILKNINANHHQKENWNASLENKRTNYQNNNSNIRYHQKNDYTEKEQNNIKNKNKENNDTKKDGHLIS